MFLSFLKMNVDFSIEYLCKFSEKIEKEGKI